MLCSQCAYTDEERWRSIKRHHDMFKCNIYLGKRGFWWQTLLHSCTFQFIPQCCARVSSLCVSLSLSLSPRGRSCEWAAAAGDTPDLHYSSAAVLQPGLRSHFSLDRTVSHAVLSLRPITPWVYFEHSLWYLPVSPRVFCDKPVAHPASLLPPP